MAIRTPFDRKGKRIDKDAYETPAWATRALMEFLALPKKTEILEPACGTGYIVRALKNMGYQNVFGEDIIQGKDFLERTQIDGVPKAIITNPPYKDDLPERFARHALDSILHKGGILALLTTTHFLHSSGRYGFLDKTHRPFHVIFMSDRILFLVKNKPIPSQVYEHCWVIWKKGFTGVPTWSLYCKQDKKPRTKIWK